MSYEKVIETRKMMVRLWPETISSETENSLPF